MKKILSMVWIMVLLVSLAGCGGSKCTSIMLSASDVSLSQPGQTKGLAVTKEPADATDKVSFRSSDPSVATVDEYGLITAVGAGNATITVTCGDAVAFCKVVCSFEGGIPEEYSPATGTVADITECPTEIPTEEPVCTDCGGKGLCSNCGGNPVCPECEGVPICDQCDDNPGICFACDGEGGHTCYFCHGDWECESCGASGTCNTCKGSGVCKKCNGSTKVDCSTCEGSGVCFICDGKGNNNGRTCTSCKGTGKCKRCDGTKKLECSYCDNDAGKCYSCHGDKKCNNCDGDGSVCDRCDGHGWVDCEWCNDGVCAKCGGEPACQNCGGDGLLCEECDGGKCRTCGGKNATGTTPGNSGESTLTDPGNDSWIPDGRTRCGACGGDQVNKCTTCRGYGGCPNDDCTFGYVYCTKCGGSGNCPSCSGTKENWAGGKCTTCSGDGDCPKCDGDKKFKCSTCNGTKECPTCHDAIWCTTCDGKGYI